jgi:hypothetical protein
VSFRQDYILRLIEQLGDFLRRIAGLSDKRDFAAAIDAAGQAWDDVLGVPRALVDVLDTPTLASMLKEPVKVRAAAQLLAEEARALRGNGDPLAASVCSRRALELYLEARALEPEPGDDAAILELGRSVYSGDIDPRYRA